MATGFFGTVTRYICLALIGLKRRGVFKSGNLIQILSCLFNSKFTHQSSSELCTPNKPFKVVCLFRSLVGFHTPIEGNKIGRA